MATCACHPLVAAHPLDAPEAVAEQALTRMHPNEESYVHLYLTTLFTRLNHAGASSLSDAR
eukprot:4504984-Amphidinium_carterae.1